MEELKGTRATLDVIVLHEYIPKQPNSPHATTLRNTLYVGTRLCGGLIGNSEEKKGKTWSVKATVIVPCISCPHDARCHHGLLLSLSFCLISPVMPLPRLLRGDEESHVSNV